ncbi:MAG: FAD-binding oxidoreductase [Pseudomonadota bacterium]
MPRPKGPLHPQVYDAAAPPGTWWEETLPLHRPTTPLDGTVTADVAIIGGGYAGLSAAAVLANRGYDTAVVDAGAIGWGAAGRNGGICGPGGDKCPSGVLDRRHGLGIAAAWEQTQIEAVEWVRRFCRDAGLGDQLQGAGEMILAHNGAAARSLQRLAEAEPDRYTPVPPSDRGDIAARGGVLMRPAFGLNPLAYVRALAMQATAAGARIFEQSPVTAWDRRASAHHLATPCGEIAARRVLVTTNGFTPLGLHDRLNGLAVPVISNIAVTRPLSGQERAAHPWLGPSPAADTRHMLCYFRLLPEGRLLYGARGDLTGSPGGATRMRAALAARIARDLPGFAQAEITHFWRGPIAATTRLTPAVGWLEREAGVAAALGWHGSGIAMASLGGRLAGTLLAGDNRGEAAIPAPMRGMPRRLPWPRLIPAYVGAAVAAMRLADAWPGLPGRR